MLRQYIYADGICNIQNVSSWSLCVTCIWFFFSSPEQKVQNFSNHLLSVVCLLVYKLFTFITSRLYTFSQTWHKYSQSKGNQSSLNEGPNPFQRWDNFKKKPDELYIIISIRSYIKTMWPLDRAHFFCLDNDICLTSNYTLQI